LLSSSLVEFRRATALALFATVLCPGLAAAQSPEERAAARDIVVRRSDAVVLVLATLRTRMNVGGRETTRDQPVLANATVLDGSGLAVMALSVLEPGEIANRSMGAGALSTEAADLRMRLAGGQEVPARVVLRDADLDLLFVRPVQALPAPLPAVDAPAGVPALLDLLITIQRSGESTGWYPLAAFSYVQMTVDRPRTYHALSTAPALGAAVFDTRGRFVGVIVRIGGARTNPLPAVLPADDIREIAKQAK
jgi:hypothetical protein